MNHLTENEIQDYLDGNLQSDDTYVKFHLDTCNSCGAQLEQYRALYSDLNADLPLPLSGEFADAVIGKVTAEDKSRFFSFDFLMVLASVITSLGVVFYYFRNEFSLQSFSGIYAWFETFAPLYAQIYGLVNSISVTGLTPILFGVLVLLFMGVVDRFIVKNYFRRLKAY